MRYYILIETTNIDSTFIGNGRNYEIYYLSNNYVDSITNNPDDILIKTGLLVKADSQMLAFKEFAKKRALFKKSAKSYYERQFMA